MNTSTPTRHAIFLDGPIGVGKSSLGRGLATVLGGEFIDGDDHSDNSCPWYCSIHRTSRSIVQTSLSLLNTSPVVVIAHPLGCTTWIYYRRHLGDVGVATRFVGLRAAFASIVDQKRGRVFDASERSRIRDMIAEGYGQRPFEDAVVDTDAADFKTTLAELVRVAEKLMRAPNM